MPKKVQITLFQIDELPTEKAKQKARQWYKEARDFSDSIRETLENELDFQSFPMERILFSLGHCQGDGVAFEGRINFDALLVDESPDIDPAIKTDALRMKIRNAIRQLRSQDVEVWGSVKNEGRYCHWNSMMVELDFRGPYEMTPEQLDQADKLVAELRDDIAQLCKNLSRKLEKIGYDEIESQESDESVDEVMRGMEYTFLEDGTRFEQ